VQLTQLQDEVIDKVHAEGQVKPDDVARLLLHDLDDVRAAIRDLVDGGLLEDAGDNVYRLTADGQAVHQAREKAHSDAVKMNTRTWQPG
jgi:Mn-dependent DtxR family transcriptional regulator